MPYIFLDAGVSQTLVGHVPDFASVVKAFDDISDSASINGT